MTLQIPPVLNNALRDYQRDAIKHMSEYLNDFNPAKPRAALVHMPTGSGKTAVIATLARCLASPGPVLVIAPRIGLREQLARDLSERFFRNAGVDPALIPRRVVSLSDGAAPVRVKDDDVVVTTVQMLTSIRRRRTVLDDAFRQRTSLVLFDEGHYEPATVWSDVVRSLPAPRIIFTATAFRDDFKLFDIDERYTYHYGMEQACRERYIRSVVFQPFEPVKSPGVFTDQVLDAYDRYFDRPDEADPDRARVIIRCDTPGEIRQIVTAVRARGRSALGIHERFDNRPDLFEYRHVPDPVETNVTLWVHQFKLLEGIDDPRFQLLALYSELRGMRALVQQVGRVIRNPGRVQGATAYVLDHSYRGRQGQLWKEFLEYDRLLDQGHPAATGLNQHNVVSALRNSIPNLVYADGRLRVPTSIEQLTHEDILLPLSANVFQRPKGFSLKAVLNRICKTCAEEDRLFHAPPPAGNTVVVFHVSIGTSPFLERGFFAEPKLGISVVYDSREYVFVYDSGPALGQRALDATPVEAAKLRKLFVHDAESRLTHVTLINSNLGADQVRARGVAAVSVDRLAPAFDEHGYVLSTATGYSAGHTPLEGESRSTVRRYFGVAHGRVSDLGGKFQPLDEWRCWADEVARWLNAERELPVFQRWASPAGVPTDPTPRNILLDATEIADRYRTVGSDDVEANTPLRISELCLDVTQDRFVLTANGCECDVTIKFDKVKHRYELRSPELDARYYSTDPDRNESLTSYFNRTQALRVIPVTDGYFYTLGQFCRPLLPFGPNYDDAATGIIGSLVAIPELRDVASEKGRQSRRNGAGWERGCLFDIVDELGGKTALKPHFEGTSILVCDDLGDESADFIMVQPERNGRRKRVVFIHAKASSRHRTCSASDLHDVCAQVQKNLREVSLFGTGLGRRRKKWTESWNGRPHTIGEVTKRIRKAPPGASVDWVEAEITKTVRDPSADREVWIITGNLLQREALCRYLRQLNPAGHAVQAAYLLLSTISNTAAAGARLTVYCY